MTEDAGFESEIPSARGSRGGVGVRRCEMGGKTMVRDAAAVDRVGLIGTALLFPSLLRFEAAAVLLMRRARSRVSGARNNA